MDSWGWGREVAGDHDGAYRLGGEAGGRRQSWHTPSGCRTREELSASEAKSGGGKGLGAAAVLALATTTAHPVSGQRLEGIAAHSFR